MKSILKNMDAIEENNGQINITKAIQIYNKLESHS